MFCPHCAKTLRFSQVSEYQVEGMQRYIRCYHCDTWLANSGRIVMTKVVSFYLAAAGFAVSYFWPEWQLPALPVSIFSLVVMLMSHLMDQWSVVEHPPAPRKAKAG
ncbi:hypothetical protein [Paraferrimonas sedimenticola]|uniref:Uncharacterized protein n=1 Tax=Paraferrimonas sedimenticola TaxID=375674 RepID=A0AA37W1E5_9GAMM|nr:hypothetical protein [Paraferrimonas sedimenticola]GLP97285.1 hypothetical protein GCM10007895_25920 [Paraferrimonas sedimenticola]